MWRQNPGNIRKIGSRLLYVGSSWPPDAQNGVQPLPKWLPLQSLQNFPKSSKRFPNHLEITQTHPKPINESPIKNPKINKLIKKYCSECVICTQTEIATKETWLMGISIQKSMTKIYPSSKDLICSKMEGRRSCPSNLYYVLPLLGGVYFCHRFLYWNPH